MKQFNLLGLNELEKVETDGANNPDAFRGKKVEQFIINAYIESQQEADELIDAINVIRQCLPFKKPNSETIINIINAD